MTKNGTPVIFFQFTVQHMNTSKSGYTEPDLNDVLCPGIPFSGENSISVQVTKKEKKKLHTSVILPIYGTKNKTR